ncbi:hypothetical protein [Lactiplantibacillus pentosus]|uniref:hypothetical protein n=1 Tax=Lactiplantibacillus pentosus TaxID=1589 RepID=UPI0021A38D8D|nr:hypothetical protein [Lactiplantibacillus pentosus]
MIYSRFHTDRRYINQQVLADLKQHTELRIEYRDTHHLVHPGTDIVHDLEHGH